VKPLGKWSLVRLTALCALWIAFAFVAFRWWIGPSMKQRAYDSFLEYARTHADMNGGGIGAISYGVTEQFLLVAFLPPLILLVLWLLRRPSR